MRYLRNNCDNRKTISTIDTVSLITQVKKLEESKSIAQEEQLKEKPKILPLLNGPFYLLDSQTG
jgi:hypothetical protein